VDAEARAQWRQRLEQAYGNWCCPICKTAYASQAQFEQMAGVVEMTRHSECGHVITYRAGGADFLEKYLAEARMPALPHSVEQPDPTPARPPRGGAALVMDCPHQRPAHRVCEGCTIEIHTRGGNAAPIRRHCLGEIEDSGYLSCGCRLSEEEQPT
jgi:hypothetical protein